MPSKKASTSPQATLYQRSSQKHLQNLQDLSQHIYDPAAWGQAQNTQTLQGSLQNLGYWMTEALLLVSGEATIEAITRAGKAGKAGKAAQLGSKIARGGIRTEELAEMVHFAKLPKVERAKKVALFAAKNKGLEVAIAEVGKGSEATTTLYFSVENKIPNYVGITNDFPRRQLEHLRNKVIFIQSGTTDLLRTEARALEQRFIEQYGLKKNNGTLLNKINSMAESNPEYANLQKLARELLLNGSTDCSNLKPLLLLDLIPKKKKPNNATQES